MFLELITKRRSIRQFSDKTIEPDKLEVLKEAALRSPSSRSINPWEFIFITAQDKLKKLARCKQHGSLLIANAPLAIVVLADSQKSDVWIEDCSIASTYLLLAAEALDLGACWVQIRNRNAKKNSSSNDFVKEILNIPQNFQVLSIIAIGYKNEIKSSLDKNSLNYTKIHMEQF